MKEKIGIYGGSFDPVHEGHMAVAKAAYEAAALHRVVFVPAKNQPFKGIPTATAEERLDMLTLATQAEKAFSVCDFEIRKEGVSYSVETAAFFKACYPEAALYFIMGEDSYFTLPKWRESEKLLTMVTPLVVTRTGERRREIEENACYISMPPVEISSTDIRQRIRSGISLEGLVPPRVEAYIKEKEIYKH